MRTERAIGKNLDAADVQPVIAETAAQAEREGVLQIGARDHVRHAQRQLVLRVQSLKRAECACAFDVVDTSQAELMRAANGAQEFGIRELLRIEAALTLEQPHCILAQDAVRLACRVAFDHAAGRVGRFARNAARAECG